MNDNIKITAPSGEIFSLEDGQSWAEIQSKFGEGWFALDSEIWCLIQKGMCICRIGKNNSSRESWINSEFFDLERSDFPKILTKDVVDRILKLRSFQ